MEIGEFVPSPDNEKVPMNIKPGKWNLYLNGEQIATMDAEMIPTFENIGNILKKQIDKECIQNGKKVNDLILKFD